MDQYKDIRYLYAVEGLSQREIARRLGVSHNTVRRYCYGENIPGERKKPSGDCSRVITPEVRQFVSNCLEEDKNADPKQRHTAHKIYKRLEKELGFQGAESTVRRLVSQLRAKRKEVFVPLAFSPGEAVQVDWGTAKVIMGGKKIKVNLLCFRLCYSCAPYVIAPLKEKRHFTKDIRWPLSSSEEYQKLLSMTIVNEKVFIINLMYSFK